MTQKKIHSKTYSFVFAADGTSETVAISKIKGEVAKIIITIPNYTNTVTTTVSMNNGDEKEIFCTSAMAQNDEYAITLSRNECLVVGATNEEWKVTLSGVPGSGGGLVTMTTYVDGTKDGVESAHNTWFVRPSGGEYGNEDGTDFANAWDGFSNVVWGGVGIVAGDLLYVCGDHTGQFKPEASGSKGKHIVIDCKMGSLDATGVSYGLYSGNPSLSSYIHVKNLDISNGNYDGAFLCLGANNWILENVNVTSPSRHGIYVYHANNTIINNCEVDTTPEHAFYLNNANNIQMSSCTAIDFTGDGFVSAGTSDKHIINDCIAHGGVTVDNSTGFTSLGTATRLTYNRCLSYDNNHDGFSCHTANDEITFNYCIAYSNANAGFITAGGTNIELYNCVAAINGETGSVRAGIQLNSDGKSTVRNCILYGNYPREIYVNNNQVWLDGSTFNYNRYYHDDSIRADVVLSAADFAFDVDSASTYAEWKADRESGNASTNGDPLFTDAATHDYTLTALSACINNGVNVELLLDFAGNSVSSPPEIGAYEYIA